MLTMISAREENNTWAEYGGLLIHNMGHMCTLDQSFRVKPCWYEVLYAIVVDLITMPLSELQHRHLYI